MLLENYNKVKSEIDKCSKGLQSVELLPISKTFDVENIIKLVSYGVKIFGESRVKEALPKIDIVKSYDPSVRFHFIGRIQTNKVEKIVANFELIHSVDRLEAIKAISKSALKLSKIQDILVQLNLAKEVQKSGVYEEDLEQLLTKAKCFENIRVIGFMLIPPMKENPLDNLPLFNKAKELYNKYEDFFLNKGYKFKILSMGMSNDFCEAISAGSNMVRVGSMIFGKR